MKGPQLPLARREGLVIQELSDEVLVYDLNSNKAHCLNQTAATIWKACDGKNSITEIINNFETQSGGKVSEDLIWLAIDQLSEKDLFENEVPKRFEGQNRRQVLKKIGLASVIALPIVASISAPTAAMAAACSGTVTDCIGCNPGTPCTGGTGCTTASCSCQSGLCVNNPVPAIQQSTQRLK